MVFRFCLDVKGRGAENGIHPVLRRKDILTPYCQNRVPDVCRLGAGDHGRLSAGWAVLPGAGVAPDVPAALDGKPALVGGSAGTGQLAAAGAAVGCGGYDVAVGAVGQASDGGGTVAEFAEIAARCGDPLAEPAGTMAP